MVTRYERRPRRARGPGPRARGSTTTSCAGSPRGSRRTRPSSSTGDNVFSMMRRIGQAKAALAADYAAQLARSAGKVVFFAKHVDVMDAAEETFAKQGVRFSSIRGDQTPSVRQRNIDAFVKDPGRRRRGLLADRGRRGHQPPGRVQHRARGAPLDRGGADPGHRPQPPHRSVGAGHRLAHPRRADDRRPDRGADRRQGRPRRRGPRRLRGGGRVVDRRAARGARRPADRRAGAAHAPRPA